MLLLLLPLMLLPHAYARTYKQADEASAVVAFPNYASATWQSTGS